ncbi:MAG: hypothetical protein WCF85_16295 [Rhodospirillaceae bacterium]
MNRVVVTDADPTPITLTVYGGDGDRIDVAVPPLRALALARELVQAAEGRLVVTDPAVTRSVALRD